ncbi:hypothetical protein GCM10010156_19410 [Planobispora rosea]|uniref:Peptidase inhibitor family I36 n=1 Tax=Planobispora rosea TaxID=35762 RepID=A0A8J3WC91_PLARO|nr:hypothetical protein GCM10010156_19410 [Planobispora rosea]GIH83960.1 hypothetical protein Pro02_23680 [Planobispora rosea]
MKKRTGKIVGSLAVCMAVLVAMLGFATPAGATESGCNGWACVKVYGDSTWVSTVEARTNGPLVVLSFYGHFRIWGPGFAFNTPDQNNSWSILHQRAINRHLPNGSKVCSEAYQKNSNGTYTRRGLPCVTIVR